MQLVYVSSSAPVLAPADLEALGAAAKSRNAAAGITGLLLYQGRAFCGVLEGPRARVFQRVEEIIADPRHRGLRILREEKVEKRRFANWSFGVLPVPDRAEDQPPEDFIRSLARRLQ